MTSPACGLHFCSGSKGGGILRRLGVFFLICELIHAGRASGERAFTYEDLTALIQRDGLTSIESVVEKLPEGLRANFTLMRESKSLQAADAEHPRVILFGEDGKLLLGFSTYPKRAGYYDLEAIQYRAGGTFEFHRITFPSPGRPGKDVLFSEKNPALCLDCHRTDPRPNWLSYHIWPGTYGETDDVPLGDELAKWKAFRQSSFGKGRTASLVLRPGSALSPYETTNRGRLRFRPNLRLLEVVMALNAERNLRLLKENAKYGQLKWLFLLSRLKCELSGFDPRAEIVRLFGEKAASPLGEWAQPTAENLFGYLVRGAGLEELDWSPQLDEKVLLFGPYSFYSGFLSWEKNSLLQADIVVGKMVQDELPFFLPYYAPFRMNEDRFAADKEDLPLAKQLDDLMSLMDFKKMTGACPLLRNAYEQSINPAGRSAGAWRSAAKTSRSRS